MRKIINLNTNWAFHFGEIKKPNFLAKKSYAFGGLTEPLGDEEGELLPLGAGGKHFLNLISGGHPDIGLHNLAGTELIDSLNENWKKVNIPDDWKRREPYENDPAILMQGSKPDGIAYYRRTFKLPNNLNENKKYILHFDGIMGSSDIWFNGAYLGHNDSGYVSIDLDVSECIRFAEDGLNVILVRNDTTTGSEGWWYEGAGIYKKVWLEVTDLVHAERDTFFVRTLTLDEKSAQIQVEFTVHNEEDRSITMRPNLSIDGKNILFDQLDIAKHQKSNFVKKINLTNPQTWTPEHPYLYDVKLTVLNDELIQTVGLKTVSYNTNGFILNGHPYQLRGACEHQDFGGVGVALNQDIIDYKIHTLKKMGVNALRSSHHFASQELLDACDRLGIILMNENRLLEATSWRLDNLCKMVKKSRSHVSIAFWSIANEEIVGNTNYAVRSVKRLTETIRRLDPDKLLVSAELLNPEGIVNDNYLKYFDILGVNYPEAGVMGNGAELIHKSHPHLPMMSTENASYFSTRGIYKDNDKKCYCTNFGSMYSMVLSGKRKPGEPGVGGTAHPKEVMAYLKSHPYMGGAFLWTGLDYYGEPSPFGWPGISSQFGICDLGGLPKDYYYYYQANWTQPPMVHIMPTWNEKRLEIKNGNTKVRVFSNAEEVEIFINGRSQGKKKVIDCQTNWDVTYERGKLTANAYIENKLVAIDEKITGEKIVAIKVLPRYQGKSTTIFELRAVDFNDNLVPVADSLVTLECENGEILGLTNGDPSDTSQYSLDTIRLFSGKAIVIVKHTEKKQPKILVKIK
ncbi:MAG: DUF4982 domain-containing protein [Lactobacillus sp.]|uniref:glycoside hydrolase family 2 TIM barrel-domain containing protein n=1 Tax=Lactobacillus sp. TaxID=1591 RepID=UPI0023D4B6F1|nr:glycoside hydrolase family 2 TIM barrel-domain containing protein [Lactobacillus sp.]MDE7049423.1 DUF4982 domain-containing protein [Lactobacillus sp.]